jgi:hypothetical protein
MTQFYVLTLNCADLEGTCTASEICKREGPRVMLA